MPPDDQPHVTAHQPGSSLLPRRWVKTQLPAVIGGGTGADAGDIVRAAWAPGAQILIADLTATASWTAASLQGLLPAHRYLASRGTELRLVVWSSELYAALRAAGVTAHVQVFSNFEAALRAQAGRGPDG